MKSPCLSRFTACPDLSGTLSGRTTGEPLSLQRSDMSIADEMSNSRAPAERNVY